MGYKFDDTTNTFGILSWFEPFFFEKKKKSKGRILIIVNIIIIIISFRQSHTLSIIEGWFRS